MRRALTSRRRWLPAALLAALLVVVAVRSIGHPPVDRELAEHISALGITPYVLDVEGADLVNVDISDDGDAVVLDYTGSYFVGDQEGELAESRFTVVLRRSPRSDLCGHRRRGPEPGGGSWTCHDNRIVSSFEEFSTYTVLKGRTELTLDPEGGFKAKAFAALDSARRVSATELARHSDGHHEG